MPLEIQVHNHSDQQRGSVATIKLSGSLDTATSPDLEKQLSPILTSGVKEVVFDLAHLKFLSSAGLRVFATARKTLKGRGGQAIFGSLQPQIREVFDIIKSLGGMAIFENAEEIDRYLTERQQAINPDSVK
jgi:anti-sigma B factor antagonist